MNWGHSIIIVFVVFAGALLTLVYKTMKSGVDMVTADYYAEELKYQDNIDARKNVHTLSLPVSITQPGDSIEVTFPKEMQLQPVTGEIHFYRPSDSRRDFKLPADLNAQGKVVVSRTRFIKGNYRVKVQYEHNGIPYFQELQLFVQ